MRYWILPVLFVTFAAAPAAAQQVREIEDFGNLSRAIGKKVSIVDLSGQIREGVIEAADWKEVTLRNKSGKEWLSRADIASAERMKDDSSDGAIRGALFALSMILVPNIEGFSFGTYWRTVVFCSVPGYLFDATDAVRMPLYRAPSAAAPTLKLSLRF